MKPLGLGLVALVAVTAASIPAPANATSIAASSIGLVTSEGKKSPPAIAVEGTNGFRVLVVGTEGPRKLPDSVTLYALRRGESIAYRVKGNVTGNSLKARIGKLGFVDLRFDPDGKTQKLSRPGGCGKVATRTGSFEGRLTFTGERAFTRVDVTTGRVVPPPSRFTSCSSHNSIPIGTGLLTGFNDENPFSESAVPAIRLRVEKTAPDAPAIIGVQVWKQRLPEFESLREINVVLSAAAVSYSSSTVTISDGGPFSGTGTFTAVPQSCWVEGAPSGSLSLAIPGLAPLNLTGGSFVFYLGIPGGPQPTSSNCPVV